MSSIADTLFPDLDVGEVLCRTAAMWDLSGPIPTPKGEWLACPVCRGITVQARFWRFHERPKSPTVRWRCDVSFKCCDCAAVWVHGIALPEGHPRQKRVRAIPWREAKRILEGGTDG